MAFPFAVDQLYAPASSKGEVAGLYRGRSASGKPEVPRHSSASTSKLVGPGACVFTPSDNNNMQQPLPLPASNLAGRDGSDYREGDNKY